jgi:signal peptidase
VTLTSPPTTRETVPTVGAGVGASVDPLVELAGRTAARLAGVPYGPDDAVGTELRRLVAAVEARGDEAAAPGDELGREVAFLLTRLAMVEGPRHAERPEVARLRGWLGQAATLPRPTAPALGAVAGWMAAPDAVAAVPAAPARSLARLVAIGLLLAALVAVPLASALMGYRAFVVLTGSMEPALPVGTLLVVEPIAAEQVRTGDVITVPRPDHPSETVTHRVIRIDDGPTGRFFQTQGDANNMPDSWRVPVAGRVLRVLVSLPALGRLFQAANDPIGRMALMVLPSIFLGAMTLLNTWRGDRHAAARG